MPHLAEQYGEYATALLLSPQSEFLIWQATRAASELQALLEAEELLHVHEMDLGGGGGGGATGGPFNRERRGLAKHLSDQSFDAMVNLDGV